MNSLLLFTAAISNIAFGGLLVDTFDSATADIGDTCGDCYRLQLAGGETEPDSDLETSTFTYTVSVKSGSGCDQLRYIYLGLDNYCSRPLAELQSLIAFDFGASGNSGPDITFTSSTSTPEKLEIEIDLKHKISAGSFQTFSLIVSKEDKDTYLPVNYQSGLGDRAKRSNTDDNLLGFKSTNGQNEETCYVEVTKRSFPELCRPPKSPSSPLGIRTERKGPGEFIGCESITSGTNNCVQYGGVCVGKLHGTRGNPCDGGQNAGYSNLDGTMHSAVCIDTNDEECETDDDCESEYRCFPQFDIVDNPSYDASSTSFPDNRQFMADCTSKVCGTTNFN